ncbi:arabinogalactan endo-1,4-beta-galactosidase [Eubacterium ruminantium]|nr:arabinogalactan endo-1,4-beta-galactosidase [Eubacterium ruminantium]
MIKNLFKRTAAGMITAVFILSGALSGVGQSTVYADTQLIEKDTEAGSTEDGEKTENGGENAGSQSGNDNTEAGDAKNETGSADVQKTDAIYAEKIELSEDFYTGVDISSYLSEVESGVKFYDFDGNLLDDKGFFVFLKECGINSVRIRLWNDPYDSTGHGYGGGNCDIDRVVKMGSLATEAGLRVLVDFHYSDFWADPGKQHAPKAWEGLTVEEKAKLLHDFTADCMKKLKDAKVNVTMVQLGNETTNAMSGEKAWKDICALMKAGSEAVHEVSPEVLRAIHFTDPHTSNYYAYARYMENYGVEYEVFASSYYPYWHGTLENLREQLGYVIDNFGKKVMVVETSYAYTMEDGDGSGNTIGEGTSGIDLNYQISEQGQVNLIHDITETVKDCGEAGIGVFWWEPAWIPVGVVTGDGTATYESNSVLWEQYGSGWANKESGDYDSDAAEYYGGSAVDNQALFDFEGHPLQSLRVFDYIRNGSDAPYGVVSTSADTMTFGVSDEFLLPENAIITFTDDKKDVVPVKWDEKEIKAAKEKGSGIYTIHGIASVNGEDTGVICEVRVNEENLLKNPGFEEDKMSCWIIFDLGNNGKQPCVARKDDSSNVRTGKYCLHFWSKDPIEYEVNQTVFLKKGTYKFGCWVEGGDTGEDAQIKITARVNDDIYDTYTALTGWQQYQNPEIDNIEITEDGTPLTVGVSVKCAGNGWGAWDDFYLYSTTPGGGIAPGMEDATVASVTEDDTEIVTEKENTVEEKTADVTEKGNTVDDEEKDYDDRKSSKGLWIAVILGSLAIVILTVFIIISKVIPDKEEEKNSSSNDKKKNDKK